MTLLRRIALSCLLPLCLLAAAGRAADTPPEGAAPAPLTDEGVTAAKAALERLQAQKAAQLARLRDRDIDDDLLGVAELEIESARVKLQSLRLELQNLRARVRELAGEIATIEAKQRDIQARAAALDPKVRNEILQSFQRTLDELRPRHEALRTQLARLQTMVNLQQSRLQVLQQWRDTLRERRARYEQERTREDWAARREALLAQRARLQKQAQRLEARLATPGLSEARRYALQVDKLLAEQQAGQIDLTLRLHDLRQQLSRLHEASSARDLDLAGIEALQQQTGKLRQQVQALSRLLASHRQLVDMMRDVSRGRRARGDVKRLTALQTKLARRQETLRQMDETAQEIARRLAASREALQRRALSSRHPFPRSLAQWRQVAEDLLRGVPQQFVAQALQLASHLRALDPWRWLLILLLGTLWLLGLHGAARLLRRHLRPLDRAATAFTPWVAQLTGHLLYRLRWLLALGGVLELVLVAARVPLREVGLLVGPLAVVAVFTPLLLLNRLLFTQRAHGLAWYDRPLFEGLRASLLLGALLVGLDVVVHQSPVDALTVDTIDRLLMLALLVLSVVLLWRRATLMAYLAPVLAGSPRLLLFARLFGWLLPLSGLVTAAVGFLGYTLLAWRIAAWEGRFLAVFAGWLVLRANLIDFFHWLERRSLRRQPNGWLLAQALLHPLQLVARIVLLLAALWVLLWWWGLLDNPHFTAWLRRVVHWPLLRVSGTTLTPLTLLVAALVLGVFLWATRWSREFAYRWLFRHVRDHGARNSLAVFTQYTVAVLGIFTLLKAMGIDLTALAVLAGAIGVGIGFGLQTIANNFISGILLLIERPLRTGDIVNIGDAEGQVTRIGIRSLTVRTWDNMEVIIPNTEAITSPFVNWTHLDNIVRLVVMVGISYDDDPHQARELVQKVLEDHPAVVERPPPEVFLSGFGDSSVDLRVQFFVDVSRHDRLRVQSEVLFTIWDRFAEAGIEIPFPQRDLHIRDLPRTALSGTAGAGDEGARGAPPSGPEGEDPPLR